jgi:arylsulfatase A-like enzyme
MKRREFLAAASTTLLASCATLEGRPTAARPNIIYVFSDEHRWQSMSFTEMPQLHTPVMAHMARHGTSFTNCISNYPVCSPHRGMLMTGRWPYQSGLIDNNIQLSPHQITLGKVFQHAGYQTGYIGKWHLGNDLDARPFGFDTSLIWTHMANHQEGGVFHPTDGPPQQTQGYNATLMTNQALDYIQQHRHEPFFLMLSLHPPHATFTDAPDDKKALYPDGSLPWRPNVTAPARAEAQESAIWDRNTWPHYQGYHAHITAVDEELGRVLEAVTHLGLDTHTYVVYSSDHGTMMGSHGVGSKRQPYEESIRVPFLVSGPKVRRGQARPELFGTIDVFPTLCGLAGIRVPHTCQGQDFSPVLRGRPGPEPESQFIMHIAKDNASGAQSHPAPIFRGVRTPRYTYGVGEEQVWGLYDNIADPYQLTNLKDDPALARVRHELHELLRSWLRRADDPFPLIELE